MKHLYLIFALIALGLTIYQYFIIDTIGLYQARLKWAFETTRLDYEAQRKLTLECQQDVHDLRLRNGESQGVPKTR